MSRSHPGVEADIRSAWLWYGERSQQAAQNFEAEVRAAQALAAQAGGVLRLARAARLVADLGQQPADRAAAEALKAQLLRGVPPWGVEAALAAWGKGPLPV